MKGSSVTDAAFVEEGGGVFVVDVDRTRVSCDETKNVGRKNGLAEDPLALARRHHHISTHTHTHTYTPTLTQLAMNEEIYFPSLTHMYMHTHYVCGLERERERERE